MAKQYQEGAACKGIMLKMGQLILLLEIFLPNSLWRLVNNVLALIKSKLLMRAGWEIARDFRRNFCHQNFDYPPLVLM